MSRPISVIIPNFNDTRVKRALGSLAAQSFSEFELIVVDGGSTKDEVHAIYKKYESIIDTLIVERDEGLFDALNKGLARARGDYIYLMGSDDFLGDDFVLEAIQAEISSDPQDGYCIGARFFTDAGQIIRDWTPRKVTARLIRWGVFPPHFSLFLSQKIYADVGVFDLTKGTVGADSYWMLMLGKHDHKIKVVRDHYLYMEHGGTSTGSLRNIRIAFQNVALTARELGYTNWVLIPIIKVLVKLPQFLAARKLPNLQQR